jgi:hypothetical protein
MKLMEMRECAAETPAHFIKVMPDVPFSEDDIIVEFVPKSKMVQRYLALREICCPMRVWNDGKEKQLATEVRGNAIIGKTKSAVIVRIDYRLPESVLRTVMFHEYMHIFCAKTEVDGEHFIDVYGTGLTFDDDDIIDFGYRFRSEFVAQYYALKHTESRKPPFAAVQDFIFDCMVDVEVGNTGAGSNFAQTCARLMTCADFDDILVRL